MLFLKHVKMVSDWEGPIIISIFTLVVVHTSTWCHCRSNAQGWVCFPCFFLFPLLLVQSLHVSSFPSLLVSCRCCLFLSIHSLFFPSRFVNACFFPSHTCLVPPVFSSLLFFFYFLSPSSIKFPSLRLCLLCPYILLYFSSQLQGTLWWPQVVTGGSCSSQLMEDKMEICQLLRWKILRVRHWCSE